MHTHTHTHTHTSLLIFSRALSSSLFCSSRSLLPLLSTSLSRSLSSSRRVSSSLSLVRRVAPLFASSSWDFRERFSSSRASTASSASELRCVLEWSLVWEKSRKKNNIYHAAEEFIFYQHFHSVLLYVWEAKHCDRYIIKGFHRELNCMQTSAQDLTPVSSTCADLCWLNAHTDLCMPALVTWSSHIKVNKIMALKTAVTRRGSDTQRAQCTSYADSSRRDYFLSFNVWVSPWI